MSAEVEDDGSFEELCAAYEESDQIEYEQVMAELDAQNNGTTSS